MARNPVYNDEVAQLAKKRYNSSKEYCKPYFDRFLDNYKHYFIRTIEEAIEGDSEAYPFYSTMMLPISFQIVETILPRVFSKLPTFSITTDQKNDENDELALRELIKYQMQHPYLIDDPIFARIVNFLKELFITGNSWGEVPWMYKEAKVNEYQPYSLQMGIETPSWDNLGIIDSYGVQPDWALVQTDKKLIDAPVFHNRSIFHVFPDPKRKRVSDLRWVIIEDFMSLEEILDMVKISPKKYKNIEELKKMKAMTEGQKRSDTNYDQEIASIFGASDFTDKENGDQLYKVWYIKEPYKLQIVINEKLTIRDSDNPNGDGKIGMFLCKDISVPNQLYAWGEIDPIKKIEDSMTDQANMRNDSVFYDLLRMWKLDPTTLIDGEQFYPEPGAIVQMSDMTGLETIETGNTNASAYREYEEWDKIVQATTGVTDYATGQNTPGMTDTASGIEALQSAANARFMMKLQMFEQMGLKAMGTMYVQRNLMFFDEPQAVNSSELGKMIITPDQIRRIRGNVNFIVETGSTENINQQKELNKWKVINDFIAENKPPFDNLTQEALDYVAKRFLYAMGEQDPDKIIIRKPLPTTPMGDTNALGGAMPADLAGAMQQAGIAPNANAQPNTDANAAPIDQNQADTQTA